MFPLRPILLATSLATSAALAAQGSVLVVGGPGSPYGSIQAAIDAASDGDFVLVKAGAHDAFDLDGKSLVIEGDAGAELPAIHGAPTVRNVSGAAVLRNLEFWGTSVFEDYANLAIRGCSGSVLVDGCVVHPGNPGLRVSHSAAVTVVASQIEGYDWNPGDLWPLEERSAILGEDSNLYVYDSLLAGGDGRDSSFPKEPTPGAAGVLLHGGLLLAEACIATGGAGGDGGLALLAGCFPGADGGAAIELADGVPLAYTSGCALSGGAGGAGFSVCFPGSSADTVAVAAGAHAALGGWPRTTRVGSPVREGGTIVLELVHQLGGAVLLLVSGQASPALALDMLGSLLPSSTGVVLAVHPLFHPSGYMQMTATAGELGPGVQAVGLYLQPAFVQFAPVPGAVLGEPRHLLLLDQSF